MNKIRISILLLTLSIFVSFTFKDKTKDFVDALIA